MSSRYHGALLYRIEFKGISMAIILNITIWFMLKMSHLCNKAAYGSFPGDHEEFSSWKSSEVLKPSLLRRDSLTPCKFKSTYVTKIIQKLCAFNTVGILRVKLSHKVQSSKQWRLDLKSKKSPSCFTIILTTAECQQRSWNNVILTLLTCATSVPDVLHQINFSVPQSNPYQPRWGLCHSHFRKKEGYFELFFKN